MREAPNIPPPANSPAPRSRRGGRVTDRILPPDMRDRVQRQSFLTRVLGPKLEALAEKPGAIASIFNIEDLRVRLLRAGFPMGLRAQTFMVIKVVGALVGALLFMLYLPILNSTVFLPALNFAFPPVFLPLFGILGVIYGFKLPDIWLGIKIRARQTEVQLVLPDMIDLISVSVEAGLGLMSAIQRISERFDNALSEEFLRTLQEVRLGRSQTDALRDMVTRIDVPDLTTLLTAIIQAELLGLAVANVLRIQSERLRERRSQRAREAAQKAPIKMTFPLVLFIFPALFVVILGPAMIKIFMQQDTF
ncbi:tight adherence protein C [Abditibacterium utsteinense]|uniref:Tight adherence protein C n=1 Tax=Abditibacterium utsteinense TaxID=1960156 RepID=A0A2S8SSY0_9BACT|nr:type II secretion system F family protein [Abditibacterium utsteinense]PQV63886.1 tight adherence protein C [Abditibacterium utsteinense]